MRYIILVEQKYIFACRMFIKSLSSKSVLLSVMCYEHTYCGVLSVFAQSWSITASSKVTRAFHFVSLRHIFVDLRYRDQKENQKHYTLDTGIGGIHKRRNHIFEHFLPLPPPCLQTYTFDYPLKKDVHF